MQPLRFTTAGSVDDGKSTLMGRLLYDARAIHEDHAADLEGRDGMLDFARLTDGLRAEREQGITIDVAYRYFATARRRFIIADTPGHEQYTRNMATGASTADAAVILVDAERGLSPQSRRHAAIACLLGIRHLVAAVNKMDLVDFDAARFSELESDFRTMVGSLEDGAGTQVTVIPVCATAGDNVVYPSPKMAWYTGPTLMSWLESAPCTATDETGAWRLPVQYVLRTASGFRGYAGLLTAGNIAAGVEALLLPSREPVRICGLWRNGAPATQARAGDSVTVTLDREVDLGRGDWLVDPRQPPQMARRFAATLVWLHAEAARPETSYLLKHTTRTLRARLVKTGGCDRLAMNGIAASVWQANEDLYFDAYRRQRATGAFIVMDPVHGATVGAGMIREGWNAAD